MFKACAKLQESDAAFRISAEMLKELRSWFDWAVRRYLMTYCSDGRELSEAAGRKYALLYSQQISGSLQDEQKLLLERLEEAATTRWLAKWRIQSRLDPSPSAPSQWSWWGWSSGASNSEEADMPEVCAGWEMEPNGDSVPSVRAFLDEVGL